MNIPFRWSNVLSFLCTSWLYRLERNSTQYTKSPQRCKAAKMGRGIPERWTDYTKIGKPMESDGLEVKFISFKVPLKEELTVSLTKEEMFSPTDLIDLCNERNIKLGLIVDLTFTKRYYRPETFTKAGIKYVKIPVEGQMVPRKARTDKFADTVKNYLETCKRKDTVIGVHCTHGVNRTGHIICKYLIEHAKMDAQEAIDLFASARGHSIERDVYIDHLRTGQLPVTEKDSYYQKDSRPQWSNNQSNNVRGHHSSYDQGWRDWNNPYDNMTDMYYPPANGRESYYPPANGREHYYPPANRGNPYHELAFGRDRYCPPANERNQYYESANGTDRYSSSPHGQEYRTPAHHKDRFYYDDPYLNDNFPSFDNGYVSRSYGYDRKGSSRDYDRKGSSRDYDRKGSSRDYDRKGPSRDYDRKGPSRDYDRKGPSRDYDRKGSSRDYDRTGSSRDCDGAVKMDKYSSARQEDRRRHDADSDKRGPEVPAASSSSGSRKRTATSGLDEYTSPEKRNRPTHDH